MEKKAATETCGHSDIGAYCYTCNVAMCMKCTLRQHKGHDSKDTEEAGTEELSNWMRLKNEAEE
jgi:hypothetical protein